MAEIGKYLYCIIPCQEARTFGGVAVGSEGSVVHTVCYNSLAVVVSDSPAKQYEGTRTNMMAHEKVLEGVMKEYTLLPVRFGTVADSTSPADDIQKLLRSRFEEFHRLLREMENKVELGIKVFWRDEKAIFDEIVAENSSIRRLRDSLLGKSPEATRSDRMRLGEMVKGALDRKRAEEAERILVPLRHICYRSRQNEVPMDRIVVSASFLVDKAQEPEFDQAVRKLDEELGTRIALKYIGPVPPYNFVNIVVNWNELR